VKLDKKNSVSEVVEKLSTIKGYLYMTFENEKTFLRMQKSGKTEEFHRLYEKGLDEAKQYFNKTYPNIISSELYEDETFDDISPIDGKGIAKFQLSSTKTVDDALNLLNAGWRPWFNAGYITRASIMLKAADRIAKDKFLIAAILAYENGKTRTEAVADVDEGIDFLRYYALNMVQNEGFTRITGKGYDEEDSTSVMKPYGTFAVIPPFNFYAITVGMTAGPLTVGNSVLLKASSDIPLSTYLTVKMLHESGVPKDALAFISGSGSVIGKHIAESDKVAGIVFTGSRDVGMSIYTTAQKKRPKPVITEMGGKDAVIVSDKANLEKAAEGLYKASFGYSGQKCSAASLAYVHEAIYDRFLDLLLEKTSKIKLGDPRKRDTYMGPVVNRQAFEKYKGIFANLQKREKVLFGGKFLDQSGYYVEPTIITDISEDDELVGNEQFLPILCVVKVKSVKEAVEKINRSDYGLTGGIFSEDESEIRYYFDNVEVGVVYANRSKGATTGAMVGSQPFVGWKLSGTSGKGTGSFYYLPQFLREQSQTIER